MKLRRLFLTLAAATALVATAAEPSDSTACRLSLWPAVTDAGISLALNAGITETFKHTVHEWRPDGSDDRSFPSRHASWAFAASSVLSREFYRTTPWVGMGAHVLASGLGTSRVWKGRHYGGDVAAGAAIGIISAQAGGMLSDLIFGRKCHPSGADAVFAPAIDVESTVLIPLDDNYKSGFATSVRGVLPFARHWGVSARAGILAMARNAATLKRPSRGGLLTMGFTGHWQLPARSLALEAELQGGVAALTRYNADSKRWRAAGSVRATLAWQLTTAFAATASAGYTATTGTGSISAVAVTIGSRAAF